MKEPALAAGKLRVRMYRVGFGDCFLLSVPTRTGHDHILIDCGVHFRGDIRKMKDVIDDIAKETGKKLAIVIASHAHQDHISGFGGVFAKEWDDFTIGEVWLPWLEDLSNARAKKLRQRRMALAAVLQSHFAATPRDPVMEDLIVNVTGVAPAGFASMGPTESAMEVLRSGFHGTANVQYLKAGDERRTAGGIRGLTAHVLAPCENESFLSRVDPPRSQRYMAVDAEKAREHGAILPFADQWTAKGSTKGLQRLSLGEVQNLRAALTTPMSEFAFALDNVLNNTSLVVAFRFGEELLLFPGDAQWGNWQSWMENGRDVLSNVTFYKVAHHGSYNATPKAAIEKLPLKRFAAMASTQSEPWPSIPAPKLVSFLKARSGNQYVQSDSIKIKGDGIPNKLVKSVPKKFRKGDFWYDYLAGS